MGLTINRINCPGCDSRDIRKALECKDYTVSGEMFEIWHCANCQLRFTQGIPDQESIGPYYQSDTYISHSDTGKGMVNRLYKLARNYTLNWKMKLVLQYTVGRKNSGSLLDIGAGTGAFLNRVKAEGWQTTGVEPDEGARKVAREKYRLQLQGPETFAGLPPQSFNAVTMWHVLEHVHDLHAYMEQIKLVLKKDGIAFIAVPNFTSLDAALYGPYWAAYDVPRHLYHFSPASIKKLSEKHGMKVKDSKPMWLDAFYIAMLSEKYKNGSSNLVRAVANGFRSDLKAAKNKAYCSSLVYIIEPA